MNRHFSRRSSRVKQQDRSWLRVTFAFASVAVIISTSTVGYLYHREPKRFPSLMAFSARADVWWQERKTRIGDKLAKQQENAHKVVAAAKKRKSADVEDVHFEFYTMLPNMNAPVATESSSSSSGPIFNHDALEREFAQSIKTAYVIQTGIYSNVAQADKTQQVLVQEGLASKVVKAYIDERLVYRVQVGPYEDKNQLTAAQSKLAELGIHATVRKSGDKVA